MNIMDFMKDISSETNAENLFSNKIAKRTEEKEIERFAEKVVDDVLRTIDDKFKFISRGLSYSPESKISEDDIKDLTNKLKEQIKTIPGKLKTEIESIFGITSDDDKKEEDKKEENSAVEIETPAQATVNVQPEASVASFSQFGY